MLVYDFLPRDQFEDITRYCLANEGRFRESRIIVHRDRSAVTEPSIRRSSVLDDLGEHRDPFELRVRGMAEQACEALGVPTFEITNVECQLTASGDGCWFRTHNDSGMVPSRRLTYVYFMHEHPTRFMGGELRLIAGAEHDGTFRSQPSFQLIRPTSNSIVFFDSRAMHEVLPVRVPSGSFAHSRFTINGWLHH